jgi:hypothetical protein
MRGLVQQKGPFCLAIRPPIEVDLTDAHASGPRRADVFADLAQTVDREIAAGYAVWSTNYLAHDLFHQRREYAGCYTAEECDRFEAYVARRAAEILADPVDARRALLALYARPVALRRMDEDAGPVPSASGLGGAFRSGSRDV